MRPKKTKYKKEFRRKTRIEKKATKGTELAFGDFGLKALESSWISENTLEAAKRVISRYLKKGGKIFFRVFPQKPITSKGLESSMGGGKGDVVGYVAEVKKEKIILEVGEALEKEALLALKQAQFKLPIKTKIVRKESQKM